MFLPYGYVTDCPHLDVLDDRWVCLIAADNRRVGEHPTAAELLGLQWVSTLDGKHAFTPAGLQLRLCGLVPVISVITPNFFVIPFVLTGTQRVALVQQSFARRVVAELPGLRMIEAPFGLEAIREAFWWHPDRQDEPEHAWFRCLVQRAAEEAAGHPAADYYVSR
jgi:DNA-binding transcriptional LysR family regulator